MTDEKVNGIVEQLLFTTHDEATEILAEHGWYFKVVNKMTYIFETRSHNYVGRITQT